MMYGCKCYSSVNDADSQFFLCMSIKPLMLQLKQFSLIKKNPHFNAYIQKYSRCNVLRLKFANIKGYQASQKHFNLFIISIL